MMNRAQLMVYIENRYGVLPEYPWQKYPYYAVFRHPQKAKWFAVIMDIPLSKLTHNANDSKIIAIINLKVMPELVGSLRLKKGVYPAYHMNKEHWVSIALGVGFDEAALQTLIDDSYDLLT